MGMKNILATTEMKLAEGRGDVRNILTVVKSTRHEDLSDI